MPFTKPTKEQLMKNLSEKFATFSQDFKKCSPRSEKARLCQYYETPVEGPFYGTYSLSMDLSPSSFQRSLLLRMDQSPQGRWFRWESLSIPAGMTEKEYFETVASEADFLKWYKEQDLPTYETPSVTADMVAYCFVEGKLKL